MELIAPQIASDKPFPSPGKDQHHGKGFRPSRFAITDRWGKCREFDEDGAMLTAQWCHHMRQSYGCPKYLAFDRCGCECPYMHARSADLARWLTENARNPATKPPTPWNRALHPKDDAGRLLTQGLPYVEGFCVGPKRYRELTPDYVPPTKHTKLTPQDELTTIDAFDPDTLQQVDQVRAYVEHTFEEMQEYW